VTATHVHPGAFTGLGAGLGAVLVAAVALSAAAAYLAAAVRLRCRGDAWPRWRDASFTAGGAGLAWAAVGTPPGDPFTAHMVQHLVTGMAAPLLLVLARPLTLVLRSLNPGAVRRGLLSVAHSRVAAALLFPPLAALADVGGLWLLYRTGLFAATRQDPWVHALVHLHVLAAGVWFTFAVCQLDPVRRRRSLAVRGATLLAAGAAHAVLAKTLYAAGPPGTAFTAADLHTGSQVMYYGGDLVEVALATVLAASWYAAAGRAWRRRQRSGTCPEHVAAAGAPTPPAAAVPPAAGAPALH
jgi:putative membrane protein